MIHMIKAQGMTVRDLLKKVLNKYTPGLVEAELAKFDQGEPVVLTGTWETEKDIFTTVTFHNASRHPVVADGRSKV